jgi:DNA-damage-inducible protein J
MIKTAVVRARIDSQLKSNAEKILHKLGLTQTQYINIAFKMLEEENGIPFDLHIPNKKTAETLDETDKGIGLTKYKSLNDFFKEMKI